MASFKSSHPEKAVQRDIDAATKNRERLSAQVVEYEQAVTRHEVDAKQAALAGAMLSLTVRKSRCVPQRTAPSR